eukprot:TRINITY_DN5772_c0_g1_i3.p1 TRINITY_DN5772_c0_g1~~TRINITY_DN5772_c0_g1_i3.p1  ORF type:complete len:262 (+),score=108.29 TRINITY_DN5772_c0_g1_i3:91-786(+)
MNLFAKAFPPELMRKKLEALKQTRLKARSTSGALEVVMTGIGKLHSVKINENILTPENQSIIETTMLETLHKVQETQKLFAKEMLSGHLKSIVEKEETKQKVEEIAKEMDLKLGELKAEEEKKGKVWSIPEEEREKEGKEGEGKGEGEKEEEGEEEGEGEGEGEVEGEERGGEEANEISLISALFLLFSFFINHSCCCCCSDWKCFSASLCFPYTIRPEATLSRRCKTEGE